MYDRNEAHKDQGKRKKPDKRPFYGTLTNPKTGRVFSNVEFYSIKGFCIPAIVYNDQLGKAQQVGRKEEDVWEDIISDWGQRYSDIFRRQDEEVRRQKRTFIHNTKELMAYLLEQMPEERAEKIRSGKKGCKTMNDAINLFPEVYRPFLRLRYAHDKKGVDGVGFKEIGNAVKTIAESSVSRPVPPAQESWSESQEAVEASSP